MTRLDLDTPLFSHCPERVLQFGEGNFLRAFVDWMIQTINENGEYRGSIALCQPIERGMAQQINAQGGVYHVAMRGYENGQPVEIVKKISSVSRCINPYQDYPALLDIARSEDLQVVVSNTTEAGICYDPAASMDHGIPSSFPAKVCALLYERFMAFDGDPKRGLLFLPVELIDNNGQELKRCVLRHAQDWGLPDAFTDWLNEANEFASTLVDRIVTGYPRDEMDYFDKLLGERDELLVTSELFNLWVIEGDSKWQQVLPVHLGAGNVIWTRDVTPYKKRKVRILNGAHTGTVLAAFLAGHDIVLDLMNDPAFRGFMEAMIQGEIVPIIELPQKELLDFARAVSERFLNPYIKHKLLDISLNSCAKFEARCLPSLLEYREKFGALPPRLVFALAAFIAFYRVRPEDGGYFGTRENGERYPVRDDLPVLECFHQAWKQADPGDVVRAVLSNASLWRGAELSAVPGLCDAVAAQLAAILEHGARGALERLNAG